MLRGMLEQAEAASVPCHIVTRNSEHNVRKALKVSGLDRFFESVVGNETAESAPKSEIIMDNILRAHTTGAVATRLLFVDDDRANVQDVGSCFGRAATTIQPKTISARYGKGMDEGDCALVVRWLGEGAG